MTYVFTETPRDQTYTLVSSLIYLLYAFIVSELLIAPLINRLSQRDVDSDEMIVTHSPNVSLILYTPLILTLFFTVWITVYSVPMYPRRVFEKLIALIGTYL